MENILSPESMAKSLMAGLLKPRFKKTGKWRKIKKYFKRYGKQAFVGVTIDLTPCGDDSDQPIAVIITDVKVVKGGGKLISYNITAAPIKDAD